MAKQKLPPFLQSALWSYDLKKFDPKESGDKRIIISNILNHGTDQQVRWLLKNYSTREIKNVLKKPHRGSWWKESLNYWVKIFDLHLNPKDYAQAIQNIYPST